MGVLKFGVAMGLISLEKPVYPKISPSYPKIRFQFEQIKIIIDFDGTALIINWRDIFIWTRDFEF